MDLEHLALRVGAVLGEPAAQGGAVAGPVLAEEGLPAPAVKAVPAQLGVIRGHPIADLEPRYLWAHGGNDANRLVAWDQGELGDEFAFVNVLARGQWSVILA